MNLCMGSRWGDPGLSMGPTTGPLHLPHTAAARSATTTTIDGSEGWDWRRRPDLNRGWRFCRPLPYHLATAPVGTAGAAQGRDVLRLRRGIPAASGAATTAFDQASF